MKTYFTTGRVLGSVVRTRADAHSEFCCEFYCLEKASQRYIYYLHGLRYLLYLKSSVWKLV